MDITNKLKRVIARSIPTADHIVATCYEDERDEMFDELAATFVAEFGVAIEDEYTLSNVSNRAAAEHGVERAKSALLCELASAFPGVGPFRLVDTKIIAWMFGNSQQSSASATRHLCKFINRGELDRAHSYYHPRFYFLPRGARGMPLSIIEEAKALWASAFIGVQELSTQSGIRLFSTQPIETLAAANGIFIEGVIHGCGLTRDGFGQAEAAHRNSKKTNTVATLNAT